MNQNTVITISREYGSHGHEIGKKLAEQLQIPFYDNELITIAAKESGYAEEMFNRSDEAPVSSLLYSLSMFGATATTGELPLNDKVFIIQSDIIKKVAKEGACVVVGRCANYVLRDNPDCVNVFVYADLKDKINWAISENDVEPDKAKDLVTKRDKKRAAYYNYYTNEKWGAAKNYNLCINTSGLGIDGAVEVIKAYINHKED